MADDSRDSRPPHDDEYVRGGKGRKDEIGKSGIYPASSADAPADAAIRIEGDLVSHKGGRPRPKDGRPSRRDDESWGSE
jgi:hypothetical protein